MAKAFLVEVAKSLGRDEAACLFIKHLVEDEWLLTLDDLRNVPRQRWENFRIEYKIPARFVDMVVSTLSSMASSSDAVVVALPVLPTPAVDAPKEPKTGPGNPGSLAWAAKQPFEAQMRRIWNQQHGATDTLLRLLRREESVQTYGILGRPVEKATLKGVAAFAKAAWLLQDDQSASQDKTAFQDGELDLFEALGVVEEQVPAKPPNGSRYAAVVVVGDCGLQALKDRIKFCNQVRSDGVFGEGAMVHICAGSGRHRDDENDKDAGTRSSAIEAMAKEILGSHTGWCLSCTDASSKADDMFRAWLAGPQQKDLEVGPVLLISAQPFALHHRAAFDNIVRERPHWQKHYPPWLVHCAAPATPSDVPRAALFDILGRILEEMSKRKKPAPVDEDEDGKPAMIPIPPVNNPRARL